MVRDWRHPLHHPERERARCTLRYVQIIQQREAGIECADPILIMSGILFLACFFRLSHYPASESFVHLKLSEQVGPVRRTRHPIQGIARSLSLSMQTSEPLKYCVIDSNPRTSWIVLILKRDLHSDINVGQSVINCLTTLLNQQSSSKRTESRMLSLGPKQVSWRLCSSFWW